MSKIANPEPVAAPTFDAMWISSLVVQLDGRLHARFQPYNGANLLDSVSRTIFKVTDKRAEDSAFDGTIAALEAECARQADNTSGLERLIVSAPSPSRPVTAVASFKDEANHIIRDCYALAAEDAAFAGVFLSALAEIARQGGFAIA